MKDLFTAKDFEGAFMNATNIADIANTLLKERGQVVTARLHGPWYLENNFDSVHDSEARTHCVQALLINIEAIERDSADKLLREWIEHAEKMVPQLAQTPFIQRAKKLLEGK